MIARPTTPPTTPPTMAPVCDDEEDEDEVGAGVDEEANAPVPEAVVVDVDMPVLPPVGAGIGVAADEGPTLDWPNDTDAGAVPEVEIVLEYTGLSVVVSPDDSEAEEAPVEEELVVLGETYGEEVEDVLNGVVELLVEDIVVELVDVVDDPPPIALLYDTPA